VIVSILLKADAPSNTKASAPVPPVTPSGSVAAKNYSSSVWQ
jgi:hypothetical protein